MISYSTTREKVTEAVARGWCHEKNDEKVMDTDLAEAIVEEIMLTLIDTRLLNP